jgi:RsmE family RNA methyltransferase
MYFLVNDLKSGVVVGEEAAVMFSHRLSIGEKIVVTDLKGSNANAVVERYDKESREYYLKLGIVETLETPLQHVLIQAVIDKQYLDKLVEVIGYSNYTEVILIATEYSQPTTIDLDRLTKIMTRSSLLSQRSRSPVLRLSESTLEELVAKYQPVVLDASGLQSSHKADAILVGPEGGFGESEYKMFEQYKLTKQSLGSNIYPGWLAGFVANC